MNKVILVDVDDTIANTREAILEYYRAETGDYSTSISRAKSYWYTDDLCPLFSPERAEQAFNDPKLFKLLKPLDGAVEGIKYLQDKGYEVRVCTLHTPMGIALKDKWLDKHFPSIKGRHYTTSVRGNKDVFYAHGIVDDNIKNTITSPCEIPVLLDFFGIQDGKDIPNKVRTWKELIDKEIF